MLLMSVLSQSLKVCLLGEFQISKMLNSILNYMFLHDYTLCSGHQESWILWIMWLGINQTMAWCL